MKVKRIPSNTLTASLALLSPYVPQLSADKLVDALASYKDGSDEPRLLSKHEAADRLATSAYTLVRWSKEGRVPGAVKIGDRWRFREDALTVRPKS